MNTVEQYHTLRLNRLEWLLIQAQHSIKHYRRLKALLPAPELKEEEERAVRNRIGYEADLIKELTKKIIDNSRNTPEDEALLKKASRILFEVL